MAWFITVANFLKMHGQQLSRIWGYRGLSFIALIAGGVLVILFSVERILRRMVGLPTARFAEISEE